MSELSAKITDSRAELVFNHPFFGAVVLRLNLKVDNSIPTMCVDGKTIYYSEAFAEKLTTEELTAVFVHEAMHVIFLHHTRRGGRDPKLWNVAGDYAINLIIHRNGFTLPQNALLDTKYDNMTAEEIYAKIYEELPEGDWPQPDMDDLIEAGSEEERQMVEQEAKELANTAITSAKEAGKLPKGMERQLGTAHEAKIPWQERLRDLLTNMVQGDQVWHKPNKRLLDTVYLPHFEEKPAGDIVLAIDTSGSISHDELNQFATEVHLIVQENHIENLDILWVDAEVSGHQSFKAHEDLNLNPQGGGGTAFKPAFDWVELNGKEPNAFIYFTDGYGSFNFDEPDFPVIWAMTEDIKAPWGDNIELDFERRY